MALEHRPTFAFEVSEPLEAVQARLRAGLKESWLEVRWAKPPATQDRGQPECHLILTHRAERRHFWSPWLTLDLQPSTPHSTRVGGRFSPHPSVWVGYMFAYLGLGAMTLFALIFGFSQWSLGHAPSALWVLSGTGVVTLALWWSAQVGQRLARDQMEELRSALHGAVGAGVPDATLAAVDPAHSSTVSG